MRAILDLVRGTLALWWRRLPEIGLWLCLGWAGQQLATFAALLFGANRIPALIFFALGLVWWVVCIVLTLHVLTRDLVCLRVVDNDPTTPEIALRSRRDVLVHSVVPFMIVYAAWGYADEHVRSAFEANFAYFGADYENFSISFGSWRLYLEAAVVAWVAQWVIGRITGEKPGPISAALLIFLRGTSMLTTVLGVGSLMNLVTGWVTERRFWAWGTHAWRDFLDVLPDWHLPWDLTLPESLQALLTAITDLLLPGLLTAVLIPLVWLALTATIVGWDDFTTGVRGGRSSAVRASIRNSRVGQRLATAAPSGSVTAAVRDWVVGLVEDFLPAMQAFRLVVRACLAFLGAYLLLGVLVVALPKWTSDGVLWLIGPNTWANTASYLQLTDLIGKVIGWSLACSLYVAAFDKAMLTHMFAAGGRIVEPVAGATVATEPTALTAPDESQMPPAAR